MALVDDLAAYAWYELDRVRVQRRNIGSQNSNMKLTKNFEISLKIFSGRRITRQAILG